MTGNRWGRIQYLGEKLLILIVSLLILSAAVFYISRLAPGDPLVSYYGDRVEKMSLTEREWAEDRLGLNEPLAVQYACWLENALRGDFGISYKYKLPVVTVIRERIGNTLLLGGIGFVLIFVLALLLGIACACHEGRLLDSVICGIGTVSSCIPEFWVSLLLVLVFSVNLKWLPGSGAHTAGQTGDLGDRVRHLILPLTAVVLGHLWYYAYMVRNRILEEVGADYVLLAKAKGLTRGRVLFRHCLQNVLPSYLSIMAISAPHILGGTYIIEMVFSYPGLGTLTYESARYHDYNLLMILCMLTGIIVMLCDLAVQMVCKRGTEKGAWP
ncbi:MAG: ABC transporter permease [Lachnospiraceae bacterium]|nr:ABC transporter permease [Lachnospiraceae bacterium]